jgi:hypothetical protein
LKLETHHKDIHIYIYIYNIKITSGKPKQAQGPRGPCQVGKVEIQLTFYPVCQKNMKFTGKERKKKKRTF